MDFPDLRFSTFFVFIFQVFANVFSGKQGWEPPRHETINMHGFKNNKKPGREGFVEGKFFRWKSSKSRNFERQFFCNCLITHHDVAMVL